MSPAGCSAGLTSPYRGGRGGYVQMTSRGKGPEHLTSASGRRRPQLSWDWTMPSLSRRSTTGLMVVGAIVIAALWMALPSRLAAAPGCPDNDSNDTRATASSLTNSVADVRCDGDDDWWKFTAAQDDEIRVALSFDQAEGDLDLELVDANDTVLATSATAASPEVIDHTATAAGDLFVRVTGATANAEAVYELVAVDGGSVCGTDEDEFEPNDQRSDAEFIAPTTTIDGFVCTRPDVFVVNVDQTSDPLVATATFTHNDGDLDVAVFDADGDAVATSDSANDDETATVAAPVAGGLYYIEVYGFEGSSNDYTLTATGNAELPIAISGVVENRRDGALENIEVRLHDPTTEAVLHTTTSAADGTYSFDGITVTPGDYVIEFVDPSAGYHDEWYDQQPDHPSADSLTVTSGVTSNPELMYLFRNNPDENFPDVPASGSPGPPPTGGHVYLRAIEWAVDMGIIVPSWPDGTFRPTNDTKRKQVAMWLWRFADEPTGSPANTFTDVPAGAWYEDGVDWVSDQGIITGFTSSGQCGGSAPCFKPNDVAKRQQMASWLYKIAGSPDVSGLPAHGFTDVPAGAWYEDAVTWAKHHGVFTGYPRQHLPGLRHPEPPAGRLLAFQPRDHRGRLGHRRALLHRRRLLGVGDDDRLPESIRTPSPDTEGPRAHSARRTPRHPPTGRRCGTRLRDSTCGCRTASVRRFGIDCGELAAESHDPARRGDLRSERSNRRTDH